MDLRKATAALYLILFLVINGVHHTKCEEDKRASAYTRLREHLLKNYDKGSRPVTHHKNTTVVNMALWPMYLVDLNEEKQALYLDTWFILNWVDFRLSWKPKDYEGIDIMRFGDHEVWQPDITIYNSVESNIDPKSNTHVLIYPEGDIIWVPPGTITTYCPMDPTGYPNDKQACNITVGSWTHHGDEIDLELYFGGMDLLDLSNTNPRWNVTGGEAFKHVMYYNCCAEPYPYLEFVLHLQRRVPAAHLVAFGPVVVSMMLTLAMFWLPPHSGKKILLGGIALVVLIILIAYVASSTKSSTTAYVSVSPLLSGLYIVTSAILLEILVITMTTIPNTIRSPQFLIPLLTGKISEILCLRKARGRCEFEDQVQLQEDSVQPEKKTTNEEEWYIVASATDRFLFLLYLVVIVAVHKTA